THSHEVTTHSPCPKMLRHLASPQKTDLRYGTYILSWLRVSFHPTDPNYASSHANPLESNFCCSYLAPMFVLAKHVFRSYHQHKSFFRKSISANYCHRAQ